MGAVWKRLSDSFQFKETDKERLFSISMYSIIKTIYSQVEQNLKTDFTEQLLWKKEFALNM